MDTPSNANSRNLGRNPAKEDAPTSPTLTELRNTLHAAAEKPEAFWLRQRVSIHERIHELKSIPVYESRIIWAAILLMAVIGIFVLMEPRARSNPDFVAGHDQDLLVSIQQALRREVPKALCPGLPLVREMNRAAATTVKK